jgi:hypothetical protein
LASNDVPRTERRGRPMERDVSRKERAGTTERKMGLAEATMQVIGLLGDAVWKRIVGGIAKLDPEYDSIPGPEVDLIEKTIARAFEGWSRTQRLSIWNETETSMTDDDLVDTSYNGIGYALQVEVFEEVTKAAFSEADEGRKARTRDRRARRAPR